MLHVNARNCIAHVILTLYLRNARKWSTITNLNSQNNIKIRLQDIKQK